MKLLKFISSALLLASFAGHSNSNLTPELMLKAIEGDGDIKHMQKIPIGELNLIETKSGAMYLISANGRFLIKGELLDVWKNKKIENAADAYDLQYLTLSQMGVNDDDMAIFKIGNPKIAKQGYLMLDPQSDYTKKIIDVIIDDQRSYHLDIMLVPQLKGSAEIIERLWCAVDKNAALMDLVYRTTTAVRQVEDCDKRPILRNKALLGLMDDPKTPLTIRSDGYRLSGVPVELKKFLNNPRDDFDKETEKKKEVTLTAEQLGGPSVKTENEDTSQKSTEQSVFPTLENNEPYIYE